MTEKSRIAYASKKNKVYVADYIRYTLPFGLICRKMPLQITRDQMSEAVVDFKQAAQLRLQYAETHCNLGVAYLLRQKREAEETPGILMQLKSDLAAKLEFLIIK